MMQLLVCDVYENYGRDCLKLPGRSSEAVCCGWHWSAFGPEVQRGTRTLGSIEVFLTGARARKPRSADSTRQAAVRTVNGISRAMTTRSRAVGLPVGRDFAAVCGRNSHAINHAALRRPTSRPPWSLRTS